MRFLGYEANLPPKVEGKKGKRSKLFFAKRFFWDGNRRMFQLLCTPLMSPLSSTDVGTVLDVLGSHFVFGKMPLNPTYHTVYVA